MSHAADDAVFMHCLPRHKEEVDDAVSCTTRRRDAVCPTCQQTNSPWFPWMFFFPLCQAFPPKNGRISE